MAILLAGLLAVYAISGPAAVAFVFGMASVSVLTGAGKFVVLAALTPGAPVGPLGLALLVIAMDTTAAFMLVPIMPLVYRAPVVGKYLNQVRQASREVLKRNRWMRRFTFGGLVAYVAVPFGGTGAVGAVFLGRLLGLGRVPIIAGTFIGAVIGALSIFGVAALGEEYVDALRDNPYIALGALAVVLLAGGLLLWRFLRVLRSGGSARSERMGSPSRLSTEVPGSARATTGGNGNGNGHGRTGQSEAPATKREARSPVLAVMDVREPPTDRGALQ
ncbi:MAG: hypothetical protein ABIJ09_09690 [Pseudomonadota bacterium]